MDRLEYLETEIRKRDAARKWWQSKERPNNLFDRAPLFFMIIIIGYALIALIPAIAMLSPYAACEIGASEPWCFRAHQDPQDW